MADSYSPPAGAAIRLPQVAELSSALRDSLGPPPVYRGESEKEYSYLYERLRSDVKPADVIEELYVRDIADYAWEVRRLRRLKVKLLESSRARGLWRVLNNLVPDYRARMKLLSDWARGDARAREEVESLIRNAGLDDSAIKSQTLAAVIEEIERIDRMIMLSDARFVALLREVDRHRNTLGPRLRGVMSEIEDAEFEDVSIPAQMKAHDVSGTA